MLHIDEEILERGWASFIHRLENCVRTDGHNSEDVISDT